MPANELELGLRRGFGKVIVDPGLGGDGRRGERVIPGDHDCLDAHAAKLGEALLDAALDDVLELDHAEHLAAFGDDERRAPLLGDVVYRALHGRMHGTAFGADVGPDGVGGAFAKLAAAEVDAAHARLRGEGHENRSELAQAPLADVELLFGEDDDAAALWRFVGEGGQLRCIGELFFGNVRR